MNIEGVKKINLKYQSKRQETISYGSLFKYNEWNIDKVQIREDPDDELYQSNKAITMIWPLK